MIRGLDLMRHGKQTIFFSSSEDMKELDDESIDVIITSPPYNIDKDYSGNGGKYDDNKSRETYLGFLGRVFNECYRVASSKCVFFLNICDSAMDQGKSEDVVRVAARVGFRRLQTIIWVKSIFGKGHYTPSGGNRRLNNVWESIFVLVKSEKYEIEPKNIGIPYSDKFNVGRYADSDVRDAGNVWFVPYSKTTGKNVKKGHDAPFPIELSVKCLKLVKDPVSVLDPFAGTGSTLRAAEYLGIAGYGYEPYPRLDVINERMLEPVVTDDSPLLPQLETYGDFLSSVLERLFLLVPRDKIDSILKEFSARDKKRFSWACLDLDKKGLFFLTFFTSTVKNEQRVKQTGLMKFLS